jgi:AraC-like DNA-binding protein
MPLALRRTTSEHFVTDTGQKNNPFCEILAKSNPVCNGCYAMQKRLEVETQLAPKTLQCFAGLCETAVPVRVGEDVVAFLMTGQILLHRPKKAQFNKIASLLLEWGTKVDMKRAEEAWLGSMVLGEGQYDSFIHLLTVFATHLAECANALALQASDTEPPAVTNARTYVDAHIEDDVSLGEVSRAVNVSANYFSEIFKKATGINFVDYVSRVRVEKTKHLLLEPHRQISAIAFDVGFKSLSQFNRTFHKHTGLSPRKYRALHAA